MLLLLRDMKKQKQNNSAPKFLKNNFYLQTSHDYITENCITEKLSFASYNVKSFQPVNISYTIYILIIFLTTNKIFDRLAYTQQAAPIFPCMFNLSLLNIHKHFKILQEASQEITAQLDFSLFYHTSYNQLVVSVGSCLILSPLSGLF